ncbi:hypothetical protein BS329_40310 [Amycolatopsis coloradensis]|uniref:Uncharacterized protein n=1 Tax=Amycolatopsis coloradensis TaxID=76021 RepID=A0A1R0KDR9_9PSEU|nr:hypothetical protein [Amycolatopsis coloradensis]OLZ43136.1 hypothetical protein BS329_40310 [Amycolatopsis coloradensis]
MELKADEMHQTLNLALGGLALIGEWFDPADRLGVDDFAESVSHTLSGSSRTEAARSSAARYPR